MDVAHPAVGALLEELQLVSCLPMIPPFQRSSIQSAADKSPDFD